LYLFFDFDRTLTNGYEFSDNEARAPIDKRIRGGAKTLQALQSVFQRGARMSVITARSPKSAVIDQLKASLQKAQSELWPLFPAEEPTVVEDFHEVKLARGGSLYASGYQKEAALAHGIIRHASELKSTGPIRVVFFDDVVSNCHSISTNLHTYFKDAKEKQILDRLELTVCWWDPFLEETEVDGNRKPSMIAVHSEDTDFSYHDYLSEALKVFGVTEEERKKIEGVYKAEEKKYGRKAASTLVEKPPEAKPMTDIENKFSNLGALFGKKPPPRG